MNAFPKGLARHWTVSGYMNMGFLCGSDGCSPYLFPVEMTDGSQTTVCLEHLPEGAFERACRIVAGELESIPLDPVLAGIDNSIAFLGQGILRELALENTCRMIRERRVRA